MHHSLERCRPRSLVDRQLDCRMELERRPMGECRVRRNTPAAELR